MSNENTANNPGVMPPKNIYQKIGSVLHDLRIEKGYATEDKIATDTGISQSVISRIEQGSYKPLTLRHLEILANAYSVTVEEILIAACS
jgi:transcriptional regulator with XRE-family HTH domain